MAQSGPPHLRVVRAHAGLVDGALPLRGPAVHPAGGLLVEDDARVRDVVEEHRPLFGGQVRDARELAREGLQRHPGVERHDRHALAGEVAARLEAEEEVLERRTRRGRGLRRRHLVGRRGEHVIPEAVHHVEDAEHPPAARLEHRHAPLDDAGAPPAPVRVHPPLAPVEVPPVRRGDDSGRVEALTAGAEQRLQVVEFAATRPARRARLPRRPGRRRVHPVVRRFASALPPPPGTHVRRRVVRRNPPTGERVEADDAAHPGEVDGAVRGLPVVDEAHRGRAAVLERVLEAPVLGGPSHPSVGPPAEPRPHVVEFTEGRSHQFGPLLARVGRQQRGDGRHEFVDAQPVDEVVREARLQLEQVPGRPEPVARPVRLALAPQRGGAAPAVHALGPDVDERRPAVHPQRGRQRGPHRRDCVGVRRCGGRGVKSLRGGRDQPTAREVEGGDGEAARGGQVHGGEGKRRSFPTIKATFPSKGRTGDDL